MANVDTIDITKLILVEQGSTPSNPASGKQKLYVRTSDHVLCLVDSAGTVTPMGAPSLTNPMVAVDDMIIGGTAGAPARLTAAGAASKFLQTNGSNHIVWDVAPAASLTSSVNHLTGNVTMTTADTFYDGPALTLSAGTWLLVAAITIQGSGGGAQRIIGKLWDGTTVADSGEMNVGTSAYLKFPFCALVVIAAGTPTWKVTMTGNGGAAIMLATPADDNTGMTNTGSTLIAVKVA